MMGVKKQGEEPLPETVKVTQNHPEIGEAVISKLAADVLCKLRSRSG